MESPKTEAVENQEYSCAFNRNGWSADDWMFVRRVGLNNCDEWAQEDECIENKDSSSHGFTSMVYRKKRHGDFTVAATMAFAERMAPSIVLAWTLGADTEQRPLYREFAEIVLWDGGINAWLHGIENDKPAWVKSAYCRFPLAKNVRHRLQVSRKGKEISIAVGDVIFGYRLEELPDELYVGVTAAEGINRMYDFSVS